ncbi:hypothetical protein [Ammoniphilus resinae]|uniref:Uncharacterized protein n=1 Tax=Ammoniphilus resinae TaxID=861532 RepID=A0ABS4GVP7_9BACL|nr:hypothetical protein [Ammoniphilus resinae]MBP1934354.1 hypothetical protein [Ammoniphilus resinae]
MSTIYLITQFDVEDLDQKSFNQHVSQLNETLQKNGCNLLIHSDQFEFSVYGIEDTEYAKIKEICEAFHKYSVDIVKTDFNFDFFTWVEIEGNENFSEEFKSALRMAQGKQ